MNGDTDTNDYYYTREEAERDLLIDLIRRVVDGTRAELVHLESTMYPTEARLIRELIAAADNTEAYLNAEGKQCLNGY